MARTIVLIGFMGAGKSTAAAALDPGYADSDRAIAQRTGTSPAELIASEGEDAFREIEAAVIEELVAERPSVLSLGGGAPLTERVQAAIAGCLVVWLDVEAETAWKRVEAEPGQERPLATDEAAFAELLEARRPVYRRLADAVVPNSRAGSLERAAGAIRALTRLGEDVKMHWAVSSSGEYPVYVGEGLFPLGGPGTFAPPEASGSGAQWPGQGRGFVITDSTVARIAQRSLGRAAGAQAGFDLPPGEQSKTLAMAERALESMAAAGLTRADHVIALGGGVVGDLAGFCAHTYQRGVPIVHVPTTVVAQVDSAYGGKTGVDLAAAKNYVGAYHMPAAVLADPAFTRSLPAAELAAGYVEVIKTALLAGGEMWELVRGLEPSADALAAHPELIFGCASYKCEVVARDERDSGLRQVLNLGHTVGHAIEAAAGYGTFRHGEAVGIGLLAALTLSGATDLREEVRELLIRWDLPVAIAGRSDAGIDEILGAMRLDKKRVGDSVPFVLIDRPGSPRHGCVVPEAEVRRSVEEVL